MSTISANITAKETIKVDIVAKEVVKVNLVAGSRVTDLGSLFVDVRSYGSFSAAIDAIGSVEKTLLIINEQAVVADKTVPPTLVLWILRPGCLNVSSGFTVTMPRPEAGRYQIFKGLGTVKVEPPIDIYPEWWGAG